jgi:hypothetical protein
MATEQCVSCGRVITESETPYISKERVVCLSCYAMLERKTGISKKAKLVIVFAGVVIAVALYAYHSHEQAVAAQNEKDFQDFLKQADADHLKSEWQTYLIERDTERDQLDSNGHLSMAPLRGYSLDQATIRYNAWVSIRDIEDRFIQQCQENGETVDGAKALLEEMQAKQARN